MELEKIKRFILNINFLPIALFAVMDIVLISFVGYLGYNTYSLYSELETTKLELEASKQSAGLIQNNKELLEGSIDNYNTLLDQLIPEEESYFKVIAALEKLGAETGVSVESYSINLDDTTDEKMSLELSIRGNPDDIETLLRDYNYVSGRLITNEEVTVTYEDGATINFRVNLIHKPFSTTGSENTAIVNQNDIDFLNEIMKKIE